MSGISRRRLLAATGAGLTVGAAGCLGSDDGDDSENGEDSLEDRTVSGEITVDNLDDQPHTIDLLIELDREIDDWVTETIDPDDFATLERDWPGDLEQFRVTARLNGGEPVDITPSNWNESDCLGLFVRVTGEDSMTHSSNTDGNCNEAGAGEGEGDGDES